MSLPAIIQQLQPLTRAKVDRLISSLNFEEIAVLLSDWEAWSLPYQRQPPGEWRRWVFRAGRGTGKTYTGARTTHEIARHRRNIKTGEIGLIARTHTDARFTMVEGPSGILATAPPDFRPTWEPGNGLVIWPNKVRARIYSADKPESIRGPNFAWVWADEPAHWPDFSKTWWTVIEPAIRVGVARAMLTTTPIPSSDLKDLEDKPGSVVSRASTFDNPFLPESVREMFRDHYAGTRIGRQELEGDYLPTNERALWSLESIEAHRVAKAPHDLARVVVAVDPAVTAHEGSDDTGIIVAGIDNLGHCYVLEDRTMKGAPVEWARAAVAAGIRHKADAIVAEVNNGGDLVTSTIRAVDPRANVRAVRASRGKVTRAEPVSALAERGLIHHVGEFRHLEDQLTQWDPVHSRKSPDRLDALVWAIHDLALSDKRAGPLRAYM